MADALSLARVPRILHVLHSGRPGCSHDHRARFWIILAGSGGQINQEDHFASAGPRPADVKVLNGYGFVEYDTLEVGQAGVGLLGRAGTPKKGGNSRLSASEDLMTDSPTVLPHTGRRKG